MSTSLKHFERVQRNNTVAIQGNSEILVILCGGRLDKRQKHAGTMLDHSSVVQVRIAP
jgi:hypothetical protein